MKIRCWGARGSVPVSGPQFNKYGGDTACVEVRSKKGDVIIIDAGSGMRALGYQLSKEAIQKITVLFSHAHLDHLMGFPFFTPLYSSKVAITLRGPKLNKPDFREVMADFFEQPYFPVQLGDKDIKSRLVFNDLNGAPFTVGGIRIETIALSHPKNGGVGFRFTEGKTSFVFLTDNELGYVHGGGCSFDDYVDFSRGADLFVHDAEYTKKDYDHIRAVSEKPWGHSLFTDAVRCAARAGVRRFGLFHHNQRRTDAQVDAMVKKSRALLKKFGSDAACFAVGSSFEITL